MFFVQEQLFGVWVTLDVCPDHAGAEDALAMFESMAEPEVSEDLLPGPHYRIVPSDSMH